MNAVSDYHTLASRLFKSPIYLRLRHSHPAIIRMLIQRVFDRAMHHPLYSLEALATSKNDARKQRRMFDTGVQFDSHVDSYYANVLEG
jgi:hypothetical protein